MKGEIDYWTKYNRMPFDYAHPNESAIYIIAFFQNKRAVFIRKDLTVICTFETRKAKQLLDQGIQLGWIDPDSELRYVSLGKRPENYPKEADKIFYVELNKPE